MRKVVAYELLSLDGTAEQPDEFITELKRSPAATLGYTGASPWLSRWSGMISLTNSGW